MEASRAQRLGGAGLADKVGSVEAAHATGRGLSQRHWHQEIEIHMDVYLGSSDTQIPN